MKPIYVGVEDKAVANSEIYAGVDNIAKKVSRMYIGDANNIARLCYDATKVASISGGTTTYDLSEAMSYITHRTYTEFANKMIMSGGMVSYTQYSDRIDMVNDDLTVTSLDGVMDTRKYNHCSCVIDNKYIAFLGGTILNGSAQNEPHKGIEIYDRSFTKVLQRSLFHVTGSAGGSIGKYGVFYGGTGKTDTNPSQYLQENMLCIDDSLTMTYTTIDLKRSRAGAAFNKNKHILFAGGNSDATSYEPSNYVEAFDTSLTKFTVAGLMSKCTGVDGANIDDYYLFGSHILESGYTSYVDVYDDSLTKGTSLRLAHSKNCTVVGTGDEVIFAGGCSSDASGSVTGYSEIEIFDKSLTKRTEDMSKRYAYVAKGAKLKTKVIMYYEHNMKVEYMNLN